MPPSAAEAGPRLYGVDHTARPTWKLAETVRFYRDVMGLPLIHAITAKGWGRDKDGHPDFLHFFFDAGPSSIAFFYYIGTQQPDAMELPRGYLGLSNHTAWAVETPEQLIAWRDKLTARGVRVSEEIRHEVTASIYFRDPNGYPIEISLPLRKVGAMDAGDAALTVEAAMALEEKGGWTSIDAMWRMKGELVEAQLASVE
jgi:catechol 2,3-dioxygenase-like lactoylglutathione lyase family enzyme